MFRPITRVSITIDYYGYMYNLFVNSNRNYSISKGQTRVARCLLHNQLYALSWKLYEEWVLIANSTAHVDNIVNMLVGSKYVYVEQ